jgi:hypothetical protein
MECKNCVQPLSNSDDFCRGCGAKVIRNRLTVKNLWGDFVEQFFNYDNRFLLTYRTLITKPEAVIDGYINGTRKKYVNVVSYFAIALTLSGLQLFILQKFFPETMDLTTLVPKNGLQPEFNMDWMYDYYSFFILVNLPLYALVSWLTFWGMKKYNYTEYLVIDTYLMAQYSMTTAVLLTIACAFGGNFYTWGSVLNVFLIIYFIYTYKRLFPLTVSQLILRILIFLGILVVLLILISILQIAYLYFNGDFEKFIEAEKAKRGVSYIASSIINWTS